MLYVSVYKYNWMQNFDQFSRCIFFSQLNYNKTRKSRSKYEIRYNQYKIWQFKKTFKT